MWYLSLTHNGLWYLSLSLSPPQLYLSFSFSLSMIGKYINDLTKFTSLSQLSKVKLNQTKLKENSSLIQAKPPHPARSALSRYIIDSYLAPPFSNDMSTNLQFWQWFASHPPPYPHEPFLLPPPQTSSLDRSLHCQEDMIEPPLQLPIFLARVIISLEKSGCCMSCRT